MIRDFNLFLLNKIYFKLVSLKPLKNYQCHIKILTSFNNSFPLTPLNHNIYQQTEYLTVTKLKPHNG